MSYCCVGMCVLAGCDFLPSVPGIGIKRAHSLVCKYRDLARVLSSMRFDRKLVVPDGYDLAFRQANAIFHHATVYDASARKLSFLKPLPAPFVNEFNGDLDFLGPDLPPSRALAIAQARLDPISMCAFDEFTYNQAELLQNTFKTDCSTQGKSGDGPSCCKLMQGDVWLGSDEELLILLSADVPEPSVSPSSFTNAPVNAKPDNGFLAHLASISNNKAVDRSSLDNELSVSNNPIVTLSPGKKRVLPPPPNNNPFKRGKPSNTSSSSPGRACFLFDTQLDEKVDCQESHRLEKATCVPHQASHEAVPPFGQAKSEACQPRTSGDSADNNVNFSSMFMKAEDSQGLVPAESRADLSAVGAQVLVEFGEAACNEVPKKCMIKMPASVQADRLDIKFVQGEHTCGSKAFTHPGLQALAPDLKDTGVLQNGDSGLTGHNMPSTLQKDTDVLQNEDSVFMSHSMPSTLHPLKVEIESSKTPTITKQTHRESKAKKGIRSSLKQSSKVVMVASRLSLLKFFQRAPTL